MSTLTPTLTPTRRVPVHVTITGPDANTARYMQALAGLPVKPATICYQQNAGTTPYCYEDSKTGKWERLHGGTFLAKAYDEPTHRRAVLPSAPVVKHGATPNANFYFDIEAFWPTALDTSLDAKRQWSEFVTDYNLRIAPTLAAAADPTKPPSDPSQDVKDAYDACVKRYFKNLIGEFRRLRPGTPLGFYALPNHRHGQTWTNAKEMAWFYDMIDLMAPCCYGWTDAIQNKGIEWWIMQMRSRLAACRRLAPCADATPFVWTQVDGSKDGLEPMPDGWFERGVFDLVNNGADALVLWHGCETPERTDAGIAALKSFGYQALLKVIA